VCILFGRRALVSSEKQNWWFRSAWNIYIFQHVTDKRKIRRRRRKGDRIWTLQ
jgi:hypothetical protein